VKIPASRDRKGAVGKHFPPLPYGHGSQISSLNRIILA
jgi:hypothetical protein